MGWRQIKFTTLVFVTAASGFVDGVPGARTAAAADYFIADTPADVGFEPNPDPGAMWVSQDIWVRSTRDPNYRPQPFPAANPPWTPQPHQNPEFSNPRFSTPNYVYVRVRNRGPNATPAGARLKLYWAKAAGGLSWPTQWVDYFAMSGGVSLLHGMEITKPRRNADSVSVAERNAYVAAIQTIDTAGFAYPDGVTYWDKQNDIHAHPSVQTAAHVNPAFLPWHREMVNRYEVLLQQTNPTMKLLYWDWSVDPRTPTPSGFSYFSPTFMGAIGNVPGAAANPTPIGAPFAALFNPTAVFRNGRPGAFSARPEADILNRVNYNGTVGTGLRNTMEQGPYHNRTHSEVGGQQLESCAIDPATCVATLARPLTAARDPFFFLLHGNVDRLWAQWQRQDVARHDRAAAPFGTDSTNVNITATMPPWDGTSALAPWLPAAAETVAKTSLHASVVTPPIYDVAPLTIPVLQPGQAVVIEIPWYPPNPADFAAFGGDAGHFCLLARVETAVASPFGMTFAEGADVNTNTRNNNNIAWKNITVVDLSGGAIALSAMLIRNVFDASILTGLRFEQVRLRDNAEAEGGLMLEGQRFLVEGERFLAEGQRLLRPDPGSPDLAQGFIDQGERFLLEGQRFIDEGRRILDTGTYGGETGARLEVSLPPELLERWRAGGAQGKGIEAIGDNTIAVFGPDATMEGIELKPGEAFEVAFAARLPQDYKPSRDVRPAWDLVQIGTPEDPNAVLGGVRFEVDISKIGLIEPGTEWRYLTRLGRPAEGWTDVGFDDAGWSLGRADLGWGNDPVTIIDQNRPGKRRITTYFRRAFMVDDPGFIRELQLNLRRNDGAVVYLNDVEVHRANLPEGAIEARTLASTDVVGIERDMFFPIKLDPGMLRQGENVIAVELHLVAPKAADADFDLGLYGNPADAGAPPMVAFAGSAADLPALYQPGAPVPVQVEVARPEGRIAAVSLYVDGKLVETRREAPFDFLWRSDELGAHDLRLEAVDTAGRRSESSRVVTIVENTPPVVETLAPADRATFVTGEKIRLEADAFDEGGRIDRVDFYLSSMAVFEDPKQVGSATEAPYEVTLSDVPLGMYMVLVVAVDDGGIESDAVPLHITVLDEAHTQDGSGHEARPKAP